MRQVSHHTKPSTKPPEYREPDCERVMRCWNEYWVSGAVWRRKDGIWGCVKAEEKVKWMLHMSPESAKLNLARRGCSWEWI